MKITTASLSPAAQNNVTSATGVASTNAVDTLIAKAGGVEAAGQLIANGDANFAREISTASYNQGMSLIKAGGGQSRLAIRLNF